MKTDYTDNFRVCLRPSVFNVLSPRRYAEEFFYKRVNRRPVRAEDLCPARGRERDDIVTAENAVINPIWTGTEESDGHVGLQNCGERAKKGREFAPLVRAEKLFPQGGDENLAAFHAEKIV
jgi:hypothetical protein